MCTIDMAVDPSNNATVALIPGQLSMKQDLDMAIFYITNWNWNQRSEELRMSITMKRKVISELMTTFFPTLLLTAITFATTFFKPFFFEAALSVNLTTMLVMTTISISKMEGLPPTSDIKMIDIWLVLCQMVPFAEVVLLTAIEYHRKDETEKRTKKRGKKKSKNNKSPTTLSIHIVSANQNQDQSQEDNLEQKRKPSLQMSLEDNGEECSEKKCYRSCWKPDLKTMGKCNLFLVIVFQFGRCLNSFYPFREESATISGVGKLHRLLCHCL